MYLNKNILALSLFLAINLAFGQDKTIVSILIYKNKTEISTVAKQYKFSLSCNDTLYNIPVHSELIDIDNGNKVKFTYLTFPDIKILPMSKVYLIFGTKKHIVTSDLTAFVKDNKIKIGQGSAFYFYYFKSFENYKRFQANHKVYIESFEPTKINFTNWQLFYYHARHERQPYIPLETISTLKTN